MSTKNIKAKPHSNKLHRYSADFKLRAVKLYLEGGYSADMVAEELGIGRSTISTWVKHYREEGEAGLNPHPPAPVSRPKMNPAVKAKAVELKKEDPQRGSRRISHLLRRFHLMQASPETVRRTLKDEGLIEPPKKKSRRNPQKPRFFERSRPNQLWQPGVGVSPEWH